MEIALEYRETFTVIGKLGEGVADAAPDWIRPLWKEAAQKADEVSILVDKGADGSLTGVWGLMGNSREHLGKWTDRGLYLAGFTALHPDPSPREGWTVWSVPAQTYLTATCSMEEYGSVFSHITREYLPAHGLKMTGACHERYPKPQDPSHLVLYFPIATSYPAAGGRLLCQSCGMPLSSLEELGKNADGSASFDFCRYCWDNGQFTGSPSLEEMVEFCIPLELKAGVYPNADTARQEMLRYFPLLKRWKEGLDSKDAQMTGL